MKKKIRKKMVCYIISRRIQRGREKKIFRPQLMVIIINFKKKIKINSRLKKKNIFFVEFNFFVLLLFF